MSAVLRVMRLSAPSIRTRSGGPGAGTGVKSAGSGKSSVAVVEGAESGRGSISTDWLPISTAARCRRPTGGSSVSVSVAPARWWRGVRRWWQQHEARRIGIRAAMRVGRRAEADLAGDLHAAHAGHQRVGHGDADGAIQHEFGRHLRPIVELRAVSARLPTKCLPRSGNCSPVATMPARLLDHREVHRLHQNVARLHRQPDAVGR